MRTIAKVLQPSSSKVHSFKCGRQPGHPIGSLVSVGISGPGPRLCFYANIDHRAKVSESSAWLPPSSSEVYTSTADAETLKFTSR